MDAFWFILLKGLATLLPFWVWARKAVLIEKLKTQIGLLTRTIDASVEICREFSFLPAEQARARIEADCFERVQLLETQLEELSVSFEAELLWNGRKQELNVETIKLRDELALAKREYIKAHGLDAHTVVLNYLDEIDAEILELRGTVNNLSARLSALKD